jgi:hypothetical protein
MKQKIVEIPLEEFKELTKALQECRKEKAELEKANKFLNEQVKEYNEIFAKEEENASTKNPSK